MNFALYLFFHLLVIYFLQLFTNVRKVDAVIASAIIATAVLGDSLLKIYEKDVIRSVIDNCTHGIIGLFSWSIVALHAKRHSSKYEIIICGILSSLVDVDHFIKAKSFRLNDALHLNQRPYLHCSTIPVIILILNIIISNCFKYPHISRCGWILWTAFTSHHIRDANRRGLWFYPFGSTEPLTDIGYILTTIVLPYVTVFLINNSLSFSKMNSESYVEVV